MHQLRIYNINPDKKAKFNKRFQDHASRIMKSYGFKISAMWYSEFEDSLEFIYILKWSDRATMRQCWDAFMTDSEWADIKLKSHEVHGVLVLAKVRDQILEDID